MPQNPSDNASRFNDGQNTLNPLAQLTLVKDPRIIPTSNYAAEGPIEPAPAASAGEELFRVVDDAGGSRNFLDRFFSGVGHLYSDSQLGRILLLSGVSFLLALGIWKATHKTSTTAKLQSPLRVTNAQTAAVARAAVGNDLAQASAALVAMGYDKVQIHTLSNMILLTRGSDIAAAARQHSPYSIVDPKVKNEGPLVIGSNPPSHYQSLEAINTNAYLGSISERPTSADILANSAAVHGGTPQN